jgi:hypothetical protein
MLKSILLAGLISPLLWAGGARAMPIAQVSSASLTTTVATLCDQYGRCTTGHQRRLYAERYYRQRTYTQPRVVRRYYSDPDYGYGRRYQPEPYYGRPVYGGPSVGFYGPGVGFGW